MAHQHGPPNPLISHCTSGSTRRPKRAEVRTALVMFTGEARLRRAAVLCVDGRRGRAAGRASLKISGRLERAMIAVVVGHQAGPRVGLHGYALIWPRQELVDEAHVKRALCIEPGRWTAALSSTVRGPEGCARIDDRCRPQRACRDRPKMSGVSCGYVVLSISASVVISSLLRRLTLDTVNGSVKPRRERVSTPCTKSAPASSPTKPAFRSGRFSSGQMPPCCTRCPSRTDKAGAGTASIAPIRHGTVNAPSA